ncbi:hypothetical protein [Yoonia sediminilitoris]|uniref:Uncharacterized protein n=1 Tax=Yoonia sediminilitoris TaxID=1286148 RepID=A0A2T6KFV4_9RHOB|nr:hypothetical protein [Yoonia sediminilitoris]PUB14191.1 hypothetical protein C8N45_10665 [Yoonia sediminilitoris]RCW95122.1 hypothetical protein DFP92_10665 [Yoonia sediminilitoris]
MMNLTAYDHTRSRQYHPDPALGRRQHADYLDSQRRMATRVGLVAMGLPVLLAAGALISAACFHDSMSHFYYAPVLGSVFVGGLILIGAFLLAYQGENSTEKWLASIAGIGAIGVAVIPANGPGCAMTELHLRTSVILSWDAELMQFVPAQGTPMTFAMFQYAHMLHSLSAIGLFLFMAYYAFFVFTRVVPERHLEKDGRLTPAKAARNRAYRLFGVLILIGMVGLAVRAILFPPQPTIDPDWWNQHNLTFWLEALAIWAFGLSWVVKGHGCAFLWPDPQPDRQMMPRRLGGAALALVS